MKKKKQQKSLKNWTESYLYGTNLSTTNVTAQNNWKNANEKAEDEKK